jgi:elongation factor P
MGFHFMHQETYEQISIQKDIINSVDLLKEGQTTEIVFHADTETALFCELPPFVEMEIKYTEPGLKGDSSSSSSLKAATVETGAEIFVPLFINTGDKIKIDTRDNSYSERVKE